MSKQTKQTTKQKPKNWRTEWNKDEALLRTRKLGLLKDGFSYCKAEQCDFFKQGCKPCEDCQAEPNVINDECIKCFNCEQREGKLRWKLTDEEMKARGIVKEIVKEKQFSIGELMKNPELFVEKIIELKKENKLKSQEESDKLKSQEESEKSDKEKGYEQSYEVSYIG